MFDTNIVVIGNVLTAPEWRRTASSNTLVANFRVASTARRVDKETGRWVDGNHLRVRVNCWRRLAEGVASSVTVGDPVIVAGRLYTRDWTDAEGNLRTSYEMEAVSVGHDLSRGRAKFFRTRSAATATVDNPEITPTVRGEAAFALSDDDAPTRYGDGLPDADEPAFDDVPARTPDGFEPVTALRGGGFEPFGTGIHRAPDPALDLRSSPSTQDEADLLLESIVHPTMNAEAVATTPGAPRGDAGPTSRPATLETGVTAELDASSTVATSTAATPTVATSTGAESAAVESNPRRVRGRVARRQPVAV
ncbi:single-stranded DNA-binding protein [Actinoplanes sp. NPDC051859]|uniref:single-stranded DNA-binding protein n=1 Tax=Actinoplanes sp. NPDC051859 TaxID=3363909 RepID=UPI00378D8B57